VQVWDEDAARNPFIATLRSATTSEQGAALLRGFLESEMLSVLAGGLDAPDARMRAAVAGSQMVGLATARYIVQVPPLAGAAGRRRRAGRAPRRSRAQVTLTRPGLTGAVGRLKEDGLVVRERAGEDGRGLYARITPAGTRRLRRAHATHDASIRRHFGDRLAAEELAVLRRVWAKLAAAEQPVR